MERGRREPRRDSRSRDLRSRAWPVGTSARAASPRAGPSPRPPGTRRLADRSTARRRPGPAPGRPLRSRTQAGSGPVKFAKPARRRAARESVSTLPPDSPATPVPRPRASSTRLYTPTDARGGSGRTRKSPRRTRPGRRPSPNFRTSEPPSTPPAHPTGCGAQGSGSKRLPSTGVHREGGGADSRRPSGSRPGPGNRSPRGHSRAAADRSGENSGGRPSDRSKTGWRPH